MRNKNKRCVASLYHNSHPHSPLVGVFFSSWLVYFQIFGTTTSWYISFPRIIFSQSIKYIGSRWKAPNISLPVKSPQSKTWTNLTFHRGAFVKGLFTCYPSRGLNIEGTLIPSPPLLRIPLLQGNEIHMHIIGFQAATSTGYTIYCLVLLE